MWLIVFCCLSPLWSLHLLGMPASIRQILCVCVAAGSRVQRVFLFLHMLNLSSPGLFHTFQVL